MKIKPFNLNKSVRDYSTDVSLETDREVKDSSKRIVWNYVLSHGTGVYTGAPTSLYTLGTLSNSRNVSGSKEPSYG